MLPARPAPSRGPLVVALVAAVVVWAAGVFGEYGWFTDELYFLACAEHPALGYVDHPPLATLLLAVVRVVFDDNLALIRIVPAAAYAAAIVQTGRLARALDGGAFAQALAAATLATAPAVLVIAGFYSMNPIELLLLVILARIALALARGADSKTWLWFGAVTGIALLTKHSALLPAGLLAVATITPAHLKTRWPFLGIAAAVAIASPNLIWLVQHDGVTFEFYRISVPLKNIEQTPLEAIAGQAMFVGPLVFVVAAIGAVWLARQPSRRRFGAMFAVALVVMMASGISRADRILAVYPMMFAAGAVALERLTTTAWRRVFAGAMLAIGALPPLPLVLPILPPDLVVRYSVALGLTPKLEKAKQSAMPQWLGDRRGWPELVDEVRRIRPSNAVVFAADYGSAGALALDGIPVISTHNEFWAWGPGDVGDRVVLAVGRDAAYWNALYTDVQRAGTVHCTGCLVDGTAIWIARGDRPGLAARWNDLRRFE